MNRQTFSSSAFVIIATVEASVHCVVGIESKQAY